jgi:hypothetical protein
MIVVIRALSAAVPAALAPLLSRCSEVVPDL